MVLSLVLMCFRGFLVFLLRFLVSSPIIIFLFLCVSVVWVCAAVTCYNKGYHHMTPMSIYLSICQCVGHMMS